MEGSGLVAPKRSFDPSATDRPEPNAGTIPSSTKRRHHHSSSATPSMMFKLPPPPLKLSAGETLFRILCPAVKTGGVIGKGGAIIRQFREETGAKIRIDESVPGCDERVILIVAETPKKRKENANGDGNDNAGDKEEEDLGNSSSNANSGEEEASPAQLALVRVFERMLKVDEERFGGSAENDDGEEKDKEKTVNAGGIGATQTPVVCRLLAPSNQVGCVLGRGGKIVEKIRQDSGAQVRILPKDHIPACASPGDELIQIAGNFSAVKRALLSVSSCLQDNPRVDATNSASSKPLGTVHRGNGMPAQVVDTFPQRGYVSGLHAVDYHSRGYSLVPGSEGIGPNHRKVLEEEVVFRLLCQLDKVAGLIGKGGAIIRALQSETGASIKIADAAPDSDERAVIISARENSEQKHSPAQEAVIRAHARIAEIGFEPGAAVVARLLVHSQQVGCLLGKGGSIVAEMRRTTGASIRIFSKEQIPKSGAPNDDVVQVIGSLQSVQDALFHITNRLRETIFPVKPPIPGLGTSTYLSPSMEAPSPIFRPRHDPSSPGHYPSSVGLPHVLDRPAFPSQPVDRQPALSHFDQAPYPYSSERPGHGPTFDAPSSPRSWAPQAVSSGNPRGIADSGTSLTSRNGLIGSGSQAAVVTSMTVEVMVPQTLLINVYGENNSNLNQIRQISGAKVVVHDPRSAATDGVVVVSGTPDQTRAAQSLIHAFILGGQTTP
ncbi:PREDICTED: KH domain-containing protein HEN4 [Nelumbo nucifera]|uniref:KH domain-containing protein HEN4 n=1 Tax=Nelumbo nucifera TaxID=4432 RepID=A0A1U8A502_NELNU|nr:PREDICTED: KH domain-containing protein HEN4 [Nelumbo nucifera]